MSFLDTIQPVTTLFRDAASFVLRPRRVEFDRIRNTKTNCFHEYYEICNHIKRLPEKHSDGDPVATTRRDSWVYYPVSAEKRRHGGLGKTTPQITKASILRHEPSGLELYALEDHRSSYVFYVEFKSGTPEMLTALAAALPPPPPEKPLRLAKK